MQPIPSMDGDPLYSIPPVTPLQEEGTKTSDQQSRGGVGDGIALLATAAVDVAFAAVDIDGHDFAAVSLLRVV